MSALHQFQIVFAPEQDRLLLRVNTTDQREFRFWLTRRLVKRLWPLLQRALEGNPSVASQADPIARREVLAFQQEQAVATSDFKTPYREDAAQMPLGAKPLLVAKVHLRAGANDQRILSLLPAKGQGGQLALGEPMVHSFCRLLADAVKKTDWDLRLNTARTQETSPPPTVN